MYLGFHDARGVEVRLTVEIISVVPINHQEDLNQQRISDVHNGWDKIDDLQNELLQMIQSFCEKFLQQKQAASIDQSPLQEMSLQEMEDLKQHYLDEILSLSNDLGIKDYRNEKIDIRFRRECENMIDELKGKFNGMSIEINKKKELQQLEQAAKLSTYTIEPSRGFNYFYDDDDEEISIPLREIISKLPPSIVITPVLQTLEPEDSLIIGNEKLSTIPEKESDELIKSSVEGLVLIPITPLSDSNEDECFTPSDNVEFLLHRDPSTQMISNEWKKILYDDPIDDLIFDPGEDIDEIDAFLDIDISTNIKDDFYDSEGDVLYLESLLSDDNTPSPPPEVLLDRDPRSLSDIDNLKIMVKVFDPGFMGKILLLHM
ncbi:hypothetical protein Tco_0201093 [Tanacetum coccineum]